jgi:hypothetical protein
MEVYIRPIRSYITLGITSSQQKSANELQLGSNGFDLGPNGDRLIRAPRMGPDRLSLAELSCYFIAD